MIILIFVAYVPTLYLNYLDDKELKILNFPSSKLVGEMKDGLPSLRRSFHN